MKRARDSHVLRAALADRDLTHRELARLAECSYGQIGFVLDGSSTNAVIARRIARALRRPVDVLFVDASSSSEQANDEQRATA